MGGQFSKHFYKFQSIHLDFGSTFLNGEDWTKKAIPKVLQITNSQWIHRNFSLHGTQRGCLRRQDMKEMMVNIETLQDTQPDEIPKDSQFLLEFDHRKLAQSNIHDKAYWVVTMEAAIIAGQRTANTGARHRRKTQENKQQTTDEHD